MRSTDPTRCCFSPRSTWTEAPRIASGCARPALAWSDSPTKNEKHRALDALVVEAQIDASALTTNCLPPSGVAQQTTSPRCLCVSAATRARDSNGSLLAVIGGKGAPGASECAAFARGARHRALGDVLVEVDALGGGLALRLGADPSDGSILGLIRATQAGEGALRELIERWRCERPGWPAVLLGPPDPDALGELAQPGAITRGLDALAELYPLVVCDVGFLLADVQQPAARCPPRSARRR